MSLEELKTVEQWEQVLDASERKPVLVFKHSTACPISAAAWEQFQDYLSDADDENVQHVFVKVIESRPVSNQIAEDLSVVHESPQAILVSGKKAVWHDSHRAITKESLQEAVRSSL